MTLESVLLGASAGVMHADCSGPAWLHCFVGECQRQRWQMAHRAQTGALLKPAPCLVRPSATCQGLSDEPPGGVLHLLVHGLLQPMVAWKRGPAVSQRQCHQCPAQLTCTPMRPAPPLTRLPPQLLGSAGGCRRHRGWLSRRHTAVQGVVGEVALLTDQAVLLSQHGWAVPQCSMGQATHVAASRSSSHPS